MQEDSESDGERNNINAEKALAVKAEAVSRDAEKQTAPKATGTRSGACPTTLGSAQACGIMGAGVASCNGLRLSSAGERWIRLGPVQAAQIDALVAELAHALGEPAETVRRLVEVSVVARGVAALRAEGSR